MRSARPLRARGAVLCETGERRTHRECKALFRFARWSEPIIRSLRGDGETKDRKRDDADDQSADPQAARDAACEEEGAGAAAESAKARGVHPRLYGDAEKAELGLAEGRQGAADQRLRGDRLHPGRRAQSAGALGGDDPRRPRQGSARRSLPHPARCARYPGRQEPQAEALQIRSKEAEVIRPLCADPRASEARPREPEKKPQPGRDNETKDDPMSRRHSAEKREINPDPKYGNLVVSKLMNVIMRAGKKSVAEGIVYGALDIIEGKTKQNPVSIFEQALDNVMPSIEVRSRRVGGATYQVPVEVRTTRRQALGIRWIIAAARERNEKTMTERLSAELLDASNSRGNAVKKREDTHRMAEANRAFSHYRW